VARRFALRSADMTTLDVVSVIYDVVRTKHASKYRIERLDGGGAGSGGAAFVSVASSGHRQALGPALQDRGLPCPAPRPGLPCGGGYGPSIAPSPAASSAA